MYLALLGTFPIAHSQSGQPGRGAQTTVLPGAVEHEFGANALSSLGERTVPTLDNGFTCNNKGPNTVGCWTNTGPPVGSSSPIVLGPARTDWNLSTPGPLQHLYSPMSTGYNDNWHAANFFNLQAVAPAFPVDFVWTPLWNGDPGVFNATVLGGSSPYSFGWDFGDGKTGTGNPVTHSLRTGTFVVAVTVTDARGNTATAIHTVGVASTVYHTDFSWTPPSVGSPVVFTNQGEVSCPCNWTLGDGFNLRAGGPPSHSYARPGNYTVVLAVGNINQGVLGVAAHVIHVKPTPVIADFSSTPTLFWNSNPGVFNATASGGSSPYSFNWDFGDGKVGVGRLATHALINSYPGPAVLYIVVLTVTDASGNNATAAHAISVTWINYHTDFSRTSASAGSPVVFADQGEVGCPCNWTFGDGLSLKLGGAPPSHTYARPGNYTVVLAVGNINQGVLGVAAHVVNVRPTSVSADFSSTPTPLWNGDPGVFNATVLGGSSPYSFGWDFGDGKTGTGNLAIHALINSYPGPAVFYIVVLTVTDAGGNNATAAHAVSVTWINYHTDFSWNPASAGSPVAFTSLAEVGCPCNWTFGDGLSGTGSTPGHSYARPGNYTVVLAVGNVAQGVLGEAAHVVYVASPALHSTTTSVSCDTPVVVDQVSTCTAIVTDTSTSPANPTGTATFSNGGSSGIFGATTCSLTASGANAATCTVSYTPSAVESGSPSITASYGGDATHQSSLSSGFALTVNKASPTVATTLSASSITVGGSVSDSAKLTGGFMPTGSVSFSFYTGDCSSGIVTTLLPPVGLVGSSATSISQSFNSAGSFSWKAVYLGDSNNNPAPSSCEPLTVDKTNPTIATSVSATMVIVGNTATDSARLEGSFQAAGTVTYSIFASAACNVPGTVVSTVTVAGGVVPSSRAVTFNSTGDFSFHVIYGGDSNNNGASSGCEPLSVVEFTISAVGFTISASPTSLTVAPTDSRSCEGQGTALRCDDEGSATITVTGLNGFSGTVTLTVSTSPNLSASLSPATIPGSGGSILTVSEGRPGNYTVTVIGTSGSIVHSVVVNVTVRFPVPLNCGGDSVCKIESDAPLSDVSFGDKKIHFTVDGTAGARGAVNVTIPRSAVPDIERIEVSVDGAKQPGSALMITADDSSYHVYFSFTFHSKAVIDIDLAQAATIFGLNLPTFYGIVGGGIAAVAIGGVLAVYRRRRPLVHQ